MTTERSLGKRYWWQDQGHMGLYLSQEQGRTVSGSVTGATVGKPATWSWACLLQMALLILE